MPLDPAREPKLTTRFDDAFVYAHRLHRQQWRKRTDRPYISHLMGVSAIVLQHGGDEDQAIAALLHDAVEDCGGAPRLAEIREKFGERVARIVDGCTDSSEIPKPPWRERKQDYIARVRGEDADTRLVSAADKLYNVREILTDLRQHGDAVWDRFKGGRDGSLWYYRSLVQAFREGAAVPLVDELDRAVAELEALASAGRSSPAAH
jgi:(p)ppGpp synthase/HD superfamily hydrolase